MDTVLVAVRLGIPVSILLACAVFFYSTAPPANLLDGTRFIAVPHTPWPSSFAEFHRVMDARMPVVFDGSPAMQWDAMTRWNASYLQQHASWLLAEVSPEGHFVYEYFAYDAPFADLRRQQLQQQLQQEQQKQKQPTQADKPAATAAAAVSALPPVDEWDRLFHDIQFAVANITIDDFLNMSFAPHDAQSPRSYYAGNAMGTKQLYLDVGDPAAMYLEELAANKSVKQATTLRMWAGGPGMTAHTHYDAVYNLFVQIHGRKRFLLFPPSLAPYVYLYPKLHPGTGQSQLDFTHPDTAEARRWFPRFFTPEAEAAILAQARVVTLGPGDVLYLPPYWMHYVTALDFSMSVSMWVRHESTFTTLAQVTVPVRRAWSDEGKWNALAFFIKTLLTELSVVLDTSPASTASVPTTAFTATTTTTTTTKASSHPAARHQWGGAHYLSILNELVETRYAMWQGLEHSVPQTPQLTACDLTSDDDRTIITDAAHKAVEILSAQAPDILHILALDYVERMVHALAGAEQVHRFLTLMQRVCV